MTLHYLQFGRAEKRRYHRKRDAAKGSLTRSAADYHYTYDLTKPDGVVPSRRPLNEVDYAIETPFGYSVETPRVTRLAAIVHCFYPEVLPSLLEKLANLPVPVDIFISTDAESKRQDIFEHCASWTRGEVTVRLAPNRGRDIAPMLIAFKDVYARYDVFLHLHTKKSPHGGGPLAGWRDYLVDNLIGSEAVARSNLSLFDDPRMGVVFPQHLFDLRGVLNWGYDYEFARRLLRRMGVKLNKNLSLEFPSGSMFFARSAALRPLLDLALRYEDFAAEDAQIDGTLAHAIERSLLIIAESAGFEWMKVAQRSLYPLPETVLPMPEPRALLRNRLKVFQPVLSRVDDALSPVTLAPIETRPLLSYPSRNARPRLNLLVPTVNPAQSFGGIATAVRLFDDLSRTLGADYDRRIVATDANIEKDGYAQFGEFVSASFAPALDEERWQLVDAFDREGGRLNLRKGDVFIATAWWTAGFAQELEADRRRYFGGDLPFVYLIQDDEPFFYGWGTKAALAQATYCDGARTLAVINSEELFAEMTAKYSFRERYCLPYAINEKLSALLSPKPRERQILVYGRPSVARNAYEIICDGLFRWQQSDPVRASRWSILFLGEDFNPQYLDPLRNAAVGGKATLDGYADCRNTASIGISLMMSPHPSYPPLEMAEAGLLTITNSYGRKNLRARFPGLVSLEQVTGEALADALETAVDAAEQTIGKSTPRARAHAPSLAPQDRLDVRRLADAIQDDVGALDRPRASRNAARPKIFDFLGRLAANYSL